MLDRFKPWSGDGAQTAEPTAEQKLEIAARRSAEQGASEAATQMSRKLVDEVTRNPEFVDEFTDPDADTDVYDWVEDELGPEFSRAHVFGYRDESYERKAEWLDLNAAERLIVERTPGRTLRKHPDVLRVMQDAAYDPESDLSLQAQRANYRPPATQDQRRVIRAGYEVVTNRKSLSVGGKGTDALTTATAEHRTVHNRDEEEQSRARKAASKLFR